MAAYCWIIPSMKRLISLIAVALPLLAFGQPQAIRQAFTTNSPTIVTNIVRNIGTNSLSHASKLIPGGTLPPLDGAALTNLPGGIGVIGTGGINAVTNGNVVSLSLYTAPVISSFVNDINTVETGSTVTAIDLDWVLSGGAITSQSINQGVGSLAIGLRTYNDTTDTTTNRTYTLTVSDGTTSPQASTTVTFLSKAYWGVSALTTLSDAQIIALSSEFATSRLRTKVVSPSNQYIYFVYPASFGTASFVVNGFADTAWTLEGGAAQNFVNASGATVSYYVYRSNDTALGTFTVEVE